MPHTLAILIPIVTYAAAPIGSGLIGSWLFDKARTRFPIPEKPPAGAILAFLYTLLWVPMYARFATMTLAGLVGIAASAVLAGLTGIDLAGAVDSAVAAMLAAIVSEIRHGVIVLPATMPERDVQDGEAPEPPAAE